MSLQVYETETMEQGDLSRSSELSTVKKKGGVQSGATAQAVINKGVDVELLVITQGLPDLLWVRLALERAGISSCEAKKGVEKCLRE